MTLIGAISSSQLDSRGTVLLWSPSFKTIDVSCLLQFLTNYLFTDAINVPGIAIGLVIFSD